jgi:hypothetical protein
MSTSQQTPNVSLPKGWKKQVRSAVLPVLSLAQYAAAYTRSWAADSTNARVRLKAELDRANEELLLLREEIRIKNARLARIDPHRRPHYPPTERMAILQTTVGRIVKEKPTPSPELAVEDGGSPRTEGPRSPAGERR